MIEIEKSTGNVYADLSLEDANGMIRKALLVSQISETLEARNWNQPQASEALDIPQLTLSNMLRGQFRNISESKIRDCLARLQLACGFCTKPEP